MSFRHGLALSVFARCFVWGESSWEFPDVTDSDFSCWYPGKELQILGNFLAGFENEWRASSMYPFASKILLVTGDIYISLHALRTPTSRHPQTLNLTYWKCLVEANRMVYRAPDAAVEDSD